MKNLTLNTNNLKKSDNNISTKKEISSINDKTLVKEDSIVIKKEKNDMSKTFYGGVKKDIENTKNYSTINIRNKILSTDLIKKSILKEYYKKKNLEKLNIVYKYPLDNEHSFLLQVQFVFHLNLQQLHLLILEIKLLPQK